MSINYNQQFLQAASLTAKTALLKKGLKNSNEVVKGFMKKMSSVTKSESESDSESLIPTSQFSPMASSTQQVKKTESTSEDSDEAEFTTNRLNVSNTSKQIGTLSTAINNKVSPRKSSHNSVSSSSDSSDSELDNKSKSNKPGVRNREDIKRMLSLKKNEENVNMNVVNSRTTKSSDESDSSSSSEGRNSKLVRNSTGKNLENHSSKNINKDPQAPESEDESSSSESEGSNSKKQTTAHGLNKVNNTQASLIQKKPNQSKYNEICDSDSDEPQNSSQNILRKAKSNSYQEISKTPIETFRKFLQENPGYEKTNIGKNADISGIDSDDEVYLLRIPKTIDPKILQGISFSLTKKSKIRTESGKYVINKESESPAPLLVYSNTLKRINPLGTFKMDKHLKKENQSEILIEEKKKQPLPENIKVRHPLFGSDYESKIQLEEQIKEKLQQALQRFQVKEKSKKKKQKVKEEEVEDKSLLISKILEERFNSVKHSQSSNCSEESGAETKKKKKKKIKTINDDTIDGTEISTTCFGDVSGPSELKPKKKKKSEIKQEVETQDESELEEPKKTKKKRKNGGIENENKNKKQRMEFEILKSSIKQEIQTEVETQDESELETPRRKKKKKIRDKDEISMNFSEMDQSSVLKKKKKDSFLIPNIKTEIESQDEGAPLETPSKKKKSKNFVSEISVKVEPQDTLDTNRKKRRKSILNSTEIMGNMSTTHFKFDVSNIEREEPVSKKSKKKNKDGDLINSLLSSVKSRLDSGSEEKTHKKKKGS